MTSLSPVVAQILFVNLIGPRALLDSMAYLGDLPLFPVDHPWFPHPQDEWAHLGGRMEAAIKNGALAQYRAMDQIGAQHAK